MEVQPAFRSLEPPEAGETLEGEVLDPADLEGMTLPHACVHASVWFPYASRAIKDSKLLPAPSLSPDAEGAVDSAELEVVSPAAEPASASGLERPVAPDEDRGEDTQDQGAAPLAPGLKIS